MNAQTARELRKAPLETPTDLKSNAVQDISGALNILLARPILELETKSELDLAWRTRVVCISKRSCGVPELQESCVRRRENLASILVDAGIAIVEGRR